MAFVVLTALGIIIASHLYPRATATPIKLTPYESGMPPLGGTRERFSVHYYLIAMLFIVFDLEVVFMLPWAVAFRSMGLYALVEMLVFVLILLVGFIYAWKRGALQWH
jgi:NADH-quinone oxidoreductase subunit A